MAYLEPKTREFQTETHVKQLSSNCSELISALAKQFDSIERPPFLLGRPFAMVGTLQSITANKMCNAILHRLPQQPFQQNSAEVNVRQANKQSETLTFSAVRTTPVLDGGASCRTRATKFKICRRPGASLNGNLAQQICLCM